MPSGDAKKERCLAYSERMPPEHAFSHGTAAGLLGLPLPRFLQDEWDIHVSARSPSREPRVRGVKGHLVGSDSREFVTVNGIRVTHPLETWRALSACLSLDQLIVMGDALVRRQNPLVKIDELRNAVIEHCGRRGARNLTAAARYVRERTDSPPETSIRLLIVRAGLPEPMVNIEIVNRYGVRIAIGDLGYPEYRVLIEYDGEYHFADNAQMFRDVDRLDAVMEEGWRVIRLNKTHLNRGATVVAKVEAALRAAGWRR